MLGAIVRLPARLALSGIFVYAGYKAAISPAHRVASAERLGVPQAELAVRANGAAMVLGGMALALGVRPRIAALGLIASLAPTTYAGHPFWTEADPERRSAQLVQFLKNVGLAGGLLAVSTSPARRHRHSEAA